MNILSICAVIIISQAPATAPTYFVAEAATQSAIVAIKKVKPRFWTKARHPRICTFSKRAYKVARYAEPFLSCVLNVVLIHRGL